MASAHVPSVKAGIHILDGTGFPFGPHWGHNREDKAVQKIKIQCNIGGGGGGMEGGRVNFTQFKGSV
jgi:hypothetical protein